MAKSKISEIMKTVHKLSIEGTISVNENNVIEIDIPDEGVKQLHNLVKKFSGKYIKFGLQEEDQEDIYGEESEESDDE